MASWTCGFWKKNPIAKYRTQRREECQPNLEKSESDQFWKAKKSSLNSTKRLRINPKRPPKERIPAILDDLVEATLKKTILKRTILKKTPISVPGGTNPIQYRMWKIASTTSLNKLTKFHIEKPIKLFTNFHQLSYSFDGFGLLT